ncbi:LytR/AlgR family response regulator transcription factor [Chitinophaga sp. 22321]|uniref:Response regulator transcription factor n=1 Tax=Chitinophaga hostae TaxID=2831022 RepID=A0ABS5J654_9BACT|nr:LytTR family DNA-binding domain-containing protein [Chitinophaga hostae]MBS0030659.1 response regulator transcription factor [Chitinophaga hostae]
MESLRCIVVDDEEGAHLVLDHYIKGTSSLVLIGNFYNAVNAMDFMFKNQVDLLFLDINMPGISGLDMLEAMSNPPLVVLTTAYTQYALTGYKYQVVDYLVKPFELAKFMAAIDHVFARYQPRVARNSAPPGQPTPDSFLVLKIDTGIVKVRTAGITHIQSYGNYVKVFTDDKMYLSASTTSEIEQQLDKRLFRRIHRSYIVALSKIRSLEGAQVNLENGLVLPVGKTYKREILEHFTRNS